MIIKYAVSYQPIDEYLCNYIDIQCSGVFVPVLRLAI